MEWVKASDELPDSEQSVIIKWDNTGKHAGKRIEIVSGHQLRHWMKDVSEIDEDSVYWLRESSTSQPAQGVEEAAKDWAAKNAKFVLDDQGYAILNDSFLAGASYQSSKVREEVRRLRSG